jgi:CubicO group peptidase (beta-lactamase class C family)
MWASIDNPLPVDQDTMFVLGSVTKTYTATALMRLVAAGQVELEARCAGMFPSSGSRTSGPRLRSPC